jgi:hypothetical protein
MSGRDEKIPELTSIGTTATSIAAADLFIVEDVSANETKTTRFDTLQINLVVGPFANDSAANTGGVAIRQPYYTADGSVKVRLV